MRHKGFAFVETIQTCLIFNKEMNTISRFGYKIEDNKEINKALTLADEWDYNSQEGKIPVGILYQKEI